MFAAEEGTSGMTRFGASALFVAGLIAVGFSAPASAETITYALTFTSTSGASTGGNGTLTLSAASVPMNIFSVTPDFVSLSATVDNITFNFTQSEVNSLGESNGTWNTIGAISAFESSGTATTPQNEQVQLQLNGFAPSHYNLRIQNVNSDLEDGFMTIGPAVVLSATPLPATLPLFAGGLGLVGFLTKRRKSAKQALTA
jgi:hypothetical protein